MQYKLDRILLEKGKWGIDDKQYYAFEINEKAVRENIRRLKLELENILR